MSQQWKSHSRRARGTTAAALSQQTPLSFAHSTHKQQPQLVIPRALRANYDRGADLSQRLRSPAMTQQRPPVRYFGREAVRAACHLRAALTGLSTPGADIASISTMPRRYTKWAGRFPPGSQAEWIADGHVTANVRCLGCSKIVNWAEAEASPDIHIVGFSALGLGLRPIMPLAFDVAAHLLVVVKAPSAIARRAVECNDGGEREPGGACGYEKNHGTRSTHQLRRREHRNVSDFALMLLCVHPPRSVIQG
jgi:hypothetical protein